MGFSVREEGTGWKLKKVSLIDGQVMMLCDFFGGSTGHVGARWGPDGTIVFAPLDGGLWQVSAEGGSPRALTAPDRSRYEGDHRNPQFLPGGEAIVFGVYKGLASGESRTIAALSLSTGEIKYVLSGGQFPHYSPSGHLVVGLEDDLLAVPFDLPRLEVTGSPVVITEGVGSRPFDLSETGTLAYIPGAGGWADRSLAWIDRAGVADALPNLEDFSGPSRPRISPDGQRVAFTEILHPPGSEGNIWVYDIARDTPTQLTFDGVSRYPVWSPDGTRLVFGSADRGDIFWVPADGSSGPELLLESDEILVPLDWSPDGKALLYGEHYHDPETQNDLWILPLDGWSPGQALTPSVSGNPIPFLRTPFQEQDGAFSPDGEWIVLTCPPIVGPV